MLTYEQFLLLKLAEEANEVAHMCMKTIQFGMYECKDGQYESNYTRLSSEIDDFFGLLRMLNDDCYCDFAESEVASANKREKVEKYLEQSRALSQVSIAECFEKGSHKSE